MVERGNRFLCNECGLEYADKETAKACEDWCRKHKSCNIEITKKALVSTK